MSNVSSIPSEHEQRVIDWWLYGSSPRAIAARLLEEHDVTTSHASIQRLIDRVADGQSNVAVCVLKARLRLEGARVATELEEVRARVLAAAGVTPGRSDVGSVEALRELKGLELADRVLHRKLKIAGVESRDSALEVAQQERTARVNAAVGAAGGLQLWVKGYFNENAVIDSRVREKAAADAIPGAAGRPTSAPPAPATSPAKTPDRTSRESVRLDGSNPPELRRIDPYAAAPAVAAPTAGTTAAAPEQKRPEPTVSPANEDFDEGSRPVGRPRESGPPGTPRATAAAGPPRRDPRAQGNAG